MTLSEERQRLILTWFINGEVGLSTRALVGAILGLPGPMYHPVDSDDFRRCLLFLRQVPDARAHLQKAASLSSYWRALVAHWDEVEQQYLAEVGEAMPRFKIAYETNVLLERIYATRP